MAQKTIEIMNLKQIIQLKKQDTSNREIIRHLGYSSQYNQQIH